MLAEGHSTESWVVVELFSRQLHAVEYGGEPCSSLLGLEQTIAGQEHSLIVEEGPQGGKELPLPLFAPCCTCNGQPP